MNAKKVAGIKAAEFAEDGMIIGLGTGSTAEYAIKALGDRVKRGLKITTISTSLASEQLANSFNIPSTNLENAPNIDLTIDGADEVDPKFDLIKGLGGALLREKIVASASKRQIIIVDETKIVDKLGTRAPLPIEVVPFAWPLVYNKLRKRNLQPVLRKNTEDEIFVTDNGNYIIDCKFPKGIDSSLETEQLVNALPGTIDNGLFVGLTDLVIVGLNDGSYQLRENPA